MNQAEQTAAAVDALEALGYSVEADSLVLAARDWARVEAGTLSRGGWRLAWAAPDLATLVADYAAYAAEVLAARDPH